MPKHEKFLELAKSIAKESCAMKRSKHCAIITKGKAILGVGVNSKITHPEMLTKYERRSVHKTKERKIFLHAEIAALLSVRYQNINGCTIYVVRDSKMNKNMSKPCNKCLHKILGSGIKQIIYTTNDGYIIERATNGKLRQIRSFKSKAHNELRHL